MAGLSLLSDLLRYAVDCGPKAGLFWMKTNLASQNFRHQAFPPTLKGVTHECWKYPCRGR